MSALWRDRLRVPAGSSRGGQFATHKGAAGPTNTVDPAKSGLTPVSERASSASVVHNKLSKLDTGALGEELAVKYLKGLGHIDAGTLNVGRNNFPVDLVQDHHVYEVKAGLAGVSKGARQWRATIGQPGAKERDWLASASADAKRKWNDRKRTAILARKQHAVRQVGKKLGKRVGGSTMAMVINPDKRIVDIYTFKGFHLRVGWDTPQAKAGYKGSFKY